MTPLQHSVCTIIKIHGDYRDSRIRNALEELSSYDDTLRNLLRRVFDEYGLIICGWSGAWDIALGELLRDVDRQKYPTFWACKGKLSQEAKNIIDVRKAINMNIIDADTFLKSLGENVQLLEARLNKPISIALITERVKKYLAADNKIEFHDLVQSVVKSCCEQLAELGDLKVCDMASIRAQDPACQALDAVLLNGIYWGRPQYDNYWIKAIEKLFLNLTPGKSTLHVYPAV